MDRIFLILGLICLIAVCIILVQKLKTWQYFLVTFLILLYSSCIILYTGEKHTKISQREAQKAAIEVYKGNTELIIESNYKNDSLITQDTIIKFKW